MPSVRLLICLLFFPAALCAQAAPEGDSLIVRFGFGNELALGKPEFFIDSGAARPFAGIASTAFPLTEADFLQKIKTPQPQNRYWIKFDLGNRSDSPQILHLYPGYADFTDVYLVSNHPTLHLEGGHLQKHTGQEELADEVAGTVPLPLAAHQTGTLYIGLRQRSSDFYFKDIQLMNQDNLNGYIMQDYGADTRFSFLQALFQGFLLCQLLYVLFQWLLIRKNEYLYYFFYLLLITLYFLSKYEPLFGIHLLFTRFPMLRIWFSKTFLILPYYFYYRFVRSFLDMPVQYPSMNKWIIPLEYFLLAYAAFDFLLISITMNQDLQSTISTFVLIGVFITSACFIGYMFLRRKVLVYYILSGSLFVGLGSILGTIFTFLEYKEHINTGIPNIMVFPEVGVILEICCFTAGLSYKSRASEKEKIAGQQKLIEQLKANEQLQSRLQHIRNKIAQDLHDDIGSTLSSISILSDLAIKEKDAGQTLATMKEVNTRSIQLMERMDDIVWSINPRNDSLENLMMRINHFATTLFEARNIDYDIQVQPQINEVDLPMEYRQHIYLILKEAINNLIKYSGATRAMIRIGFNEKYFFLSVGDNGKGFDPEAGFPGNGIYGMRNRAKGMHAGLRIQSSPGGGTQLLLQVPLG
ncbi:MAG TPA: 7TM diverse intracellular signaling domain-containing protein [Puia sp.]|nr:7TM diverse intracellular signaling domain-containing protein [Puia sp.]